MSKKTKWLNRNAILTPYMTLCLNEKQYRKALKHIGVEREKAWQFLNDGCDGTAHIFENDCKTLAVVCINPEGHELSEVMGIITHEAVHIWQYFRRDIGETNPSDEFEAYTVQHIAQRLFAEYLRKSVK